MLGSVAYHIARRGVEYHAGKDGAHRHHGHGHGHGHHGQHGHHGHGGNHGASNLELYASEKLMVLVTMLVIMLTFAAIAYTFGSLLQTLVMVETEERAVPPPAYSVVADPDTKDAQLFTDDDVKNRDQNQDQDEAQDQPLLDPERQQEMATVLPRLSSSWNHTLAHLATLDGGFRSRFRGFRSFALYSFFAALINFAMQMALSAVAPVQRHNILMHFASDLITTVALARLHAAWTLAMVVHRAPSAAGVSAFGRVPKCKHVRALGGAAALSVVSRYAVVLPFVATAMYCAQEHHRQADKQVDCSMLVMLAGAGVASLLVYLAVHLPVRTARTRLEASLLAEDEDSVVPIARGDSVAGVRGALRSVSARDAMRVAWFQVKLLALRVFVGLLAMAVFMAELIVIRHNHAEQLAHTGRVLSAHVGDVHGLARRSVAWGGRRLMGRV